MLEILSKPWPWYVAGPMIGLTVPLLLLLGNKSLGVSSSFRHICAAVVPARRFTYFSYNWRNEQWNLLFAGGLILGGVFAGTILAPNEDVVINADLQQYLATFGITPTTAPIPEALFSMDSLLTLRGLLLAVGGGLLIGFGTRYAGGCTSGHSILGLSSMQIPSLVATCSFLVGGLTMTHAILPFILALEI
ncbi:MAG TPA: YeeE/YedE thiosulfate transporter family protein [Cyclobacteriaceae bacterium]|jgi:uncharacterized membrane protein YedE/YeeE|nr:MAG: hypothetical protein DIU61_15120 [Bacteroidota bacterium]